MLFSAVVLCLCLCLCLCFTVKKDKTDDILQTINNTTKNIKFTKEEEQNNQLAFLDVLLTRTNDGTIHTQVYRKQTHTDQILNYNSNHPTQHKISCIKTFVSILLVNARG